MKFPITKKLYFFTILTLLLTFNATTVFAQWPDSGPDMAIDAKAKTEAIDALVKDLKEYYVFPEMGEKVANMIEERQARGEYGSVASAKEFGEFLTKQMYEITHDMHLHILYSSHVISLPGARPPLPNPQIPVGPRPNPSNYGFEEVKHLDGNIGYLKLTGFSNTEKGGPTVTGSMAFLANTYALIVDLRQNHGGNPRMVELLASYFFDGDVHLNDLEFRIPGTREYTLQQWWVLPYVPGERYLNKEVYILTSHETPSAAEEFSYDLQALKRATVVGETTWGGANPGDELRLGDHFQVFMPKGHAINPITKTNWEGVGIKPDIAVPQQDALKVAQKTALEHLIATATDQHELDIAKQALTKIEASPQAQQK